MDRVRTGCIYSITNLINGKVYVGRTIRNPEMRFREHCRPKKSKWNKSLINDAIQKYGKAAFEFRVLETEVPEPELDALEEAYISEIGCMAPAGYNCISRHEILNISEGTRKKMSEAKKGKKPWNAGTKGKQKAWNNGIYNMGRCKPVVATDIKTGENKYYVSAAEAVREGFNSGHITACCRGKLSHHKGFYWNYNKECLSE